MARRQTRKHIQRTDTRPQNREDVQAGVTGAKLDTRGQLIGGTLPTGEKVGTSDPANQMGGKIDLVPKLGGTGALGNTNQPNAAAQKLIGGGMGSPSTSIPGGVNPSRNNGQQPVQPTSGLDRWYAMNPEAVPGQMYNQRESQAQSAHRESMRQDADRRRTAAIQATHSEEAGLRAQTGRPIIAPSITKGREQQRKAERELKTAGKTHKDGDMVGRGAGIMLGGAEDRYYGVDEDGDRHIIPTAAKESGSIGARPYENPKAAAKRKLVGRLPGGPAEGRAQMEDLIKRREEIRERLKDKAPGDPVHAELEEEAMRLEQEISRAIFAST